MRRRGPTILVTNDDGIGSASLPKLLKALSAVGRVFAVVPDREQSGSSHSITLTRPLRVARISSNLYTLDGTPTDCVNAALLGGLPFPPIDLVVSGINHGPNLSEDVFYSGTVAGAREGALFGLPAVALSLVTSRKNPDWSFAVSFAASLVRQRTWRKGDLLNVNIPDRPRQDIRGVRVTRLGSRRYKDVLLKRLDPWGQPYFWLKGEGLTYTPTPGTDCYEVRRGYVSITPLSLDLTDHGRLADLAAELERRRRTDA